MGIRSITLILARLDIMRVLLALVVFFIAASAFPQNTCEQKNEIFKKAIVKLTQKDIKTECDGCYTEIVAAVADCITAFEWKPCVEDILGAGTPCIECVCEVINVISSLFNLDWSC